MRWKGRPIRAFAVRLVVLIVPVVAAVLAATGTSRLLPSPEGALGTALWWSAVIAASTAALLVVDRQARRLLPLAALLNLTLLFPDCAPSRFRVALRAGTVRHLEKRLEHGRRNGVGDDPSQAAASILVLASALSRHDRRTRGHSERVRGFTDLIAEELRLSADDGDRLRWAALLHDIGKVRVQPEILNKPSSLTSQEWAVIHRHPSDGARMAAPLRSWLGPWTDAIEQHHERWDGGGYPYGLAGTQISMSARIVAVADAFEVMTASRSYRRSLGAAAARDELARCAGSHFDPAVVRAFLSISIGRLRWVMAPIAWLADVPVVHLGGAGTVAESATAGLAAKAFAAVTLAVFGGTVVAQPPPASPEVGLASDRQAEQPRQGPQPPDQVALAQPSSSNQSTVPAPPPPPAPSPSTSTAVAGGAAGTATAPSTGTVSPPDRPRNGPGAAPASNPPPTASDDAAEVPSGKTEKIPVLANDTDADGLDVSTLAVASSPAHGQAEAKGNPRVLRYTAPSGYVGPDRFQYRVCDNRGACSVATVWINVLP